MRFDKNKLSLTMKLTRDLTAVRVIANPNKIFPRSLSVSLPRATLVAWWTQSACKQHLFLDYFATLVMTRTKMAARLKASRHDNLLLDRRTTFAMTIRTTFAMTIRTALGHANSHKCGWRDTRLYRFVCDLKICFQITFPFFISILFSN